MPSFFLPSFQLRKPGFSGHVVALILASLLALATGQAQAWSLDDVAGLANLDDDGYRAFLQHNNQTPSETWTNLITS
jgi:hypothetical protein